MHATTLERAEPTPTVPSTIESAQSKLVYVYLAATREATVDELANALGGVRVVDRQQRRDVRDRLEQAGGLGRRVPREGARCDVYVGDRGVPETDVPEDAADVLIHKGGERPLDAADVELEILVLARLEFGLVDELAVGPLELDEVGGLGLVELDVAAGAEDRDGRKVWSIRDDSRLSTVTPCLFQAYRSCLFIPSRNIWKYCGENSLDTSNARMS